MFERNYPELMVHPCFIITHGIKGQLLGVDKHWNISIRLLIKRFFINNKIIKTKGEYFKNE